MSLLKKILLENHEESEYHRPRWDSSSIGQRPVKAEAAEPRQSRTRDPPLFFRAILSPSP